MPYLQLTVPLLPVFADMGASVHAQRENTSMSPFNFSMICTYHRKLSTLHHCLSSVARICIGTGSICSNIRAFRHFYASDQVILVKHPNQSADV